MVSTVSTMVMMSTMAWWLWPKARLEHDNLLGDNDFIRRPSNISLARTNTPPKQKTSWWPAWYRWWWGSQENNYIISLYLNDYYIFQRDKWTINDKTPTNRALTQNRVATPCLRSGRGFTISPLVQVEKFDEIFPPFIVEKPCFYTYLHIFKRRIRGDLGDEKWDIFCLQHLSFPPCCLNDQSFCLPGPPIPLFTFFAHSVNILCTICTMCAMYNASVSAQSILYIFCTLLTVCNVNKALIVHCCRAAPGSHLAHHSGRWRASIRGSLLSQNFKHTASKSRLSVARPGFIFHKTLLTAQPNARTWFIYDYKQYSLNIIQIIHQRDYWW